MKLLMLGVAVLGVLFLGLGVISSHTSRDESPDVRMISGFYLLIGIGLLIADGTLALVYSIVKALL